MTISGHFFANCMVIFYKTAEVQTAILMHLIGLNSNWFKGYDSKSKYFLPIFGDFVKNTHMNFLHFCILCNNFRANWDLDSLSTSK